MIFVKCAGPQTNIWEWRSKPWHPVSVLWLWSRLGVSASRAKSCKQPAGAFDLPKNFPSQAAFLCHSHTWAKTHIWWLRPTQRNQEMTNQAEIYPELSDNVILSLSSSFQLLFVLWFGLYSHIIGPWWKNRMIMQHIKSKCPKPACGSKVVLSVDVIRRKLITTLAV